MDYFWSGVVMVGLALVALALMISGYNGSF